MSSGVTISGYSDSDLAHIHSRVDDFFADLRLKKYVGLTWIQNSVGFTARGLESHTELRGPQTRARTDMHLSLARLAVSSQERKSISLPRPRHLYSLFISIHW